MFNMGKDGASGSEHVTLLGKDVRFKGVLRFEGTAQIDSHLEGEIHTRGVLMIGEHGVIKGTINAGTVVSRGKIKGTIIATEKVQLLKSAILIGDVHSPSFAMDADAHIHGQVDMGPSPWTDEPSQDLQAGDGRVASITKDTARSHG